MNTYSSNHKQDLSLSENIPVLPLVFDSVVCKIPESLAKSFMTCPICKETLKKVTTITNCLHRFCERCIKKHLQATSMTCPLCGVRLSSLRQLRTDVEYGRLVQQLEKVVVIYPFSILIILFIDTMQGLPFQQIQANEDNTHIHKIANNSEEPYDTSSTSIM